MEITINNKTIQLKYSFRALMIYEKMVGKSFDNAGLTEIIAFFYSVILGSNPNIELTFDEYVDWLDSNPKALLDFSNWLSKEILIFNLLENPVSDEDLKKSQITL